MQTQIERFNHHTSIRLYKRTLFLMFLCSLLLLTHGAYSQTFNIQGNISTNATPVRYASVTFIDQSDTSKKYTTLTDTAGNYQISIITSVKEKPINQPTKIELEQNYPNPFSTTTAISYTTKKQADVKITIYDILGREVKIFSVGYQNIGKQRVVWEGRNDAGDKVATGIYFYRLQTENETLIKKMVYMGNKQSINLPLFSHPTFDVEKSNLSMLSSITGSYMACIVRIQNTNITRPKISYTEYFNVAIQKDTSIDYTIQENILEYSLCYQREDSLIFREINPYLVWAIHLNNITGTNSKTIISKTRDAINPSWSPDGKYIAFLHNDSIEQNNLYVYDTDNDTILQLTHTGNINTSAPIWTHDSKRIIFEYWQIGIGAIPYMINVDGKEVIRLKINPSAWGVNLLFADDYSCLFVDNTKLYKSNLDSTYSEYILDLNPSTEEYMTIGDFNPNSGTLLMNTNMIPGITSALIELNVNTKQINILLTAEEGYSFAEPRYSSDYSKIAFLEIGRTTQIEENLCILENGIKTRLVQLTGGMSKEWFDYNPRQFSPDGNFIAYSINVTNQGPWFNWISYLYVINVKTKETNLIDIGVIPQWNPRKSH